MTDETEDQDPTRLEIIEFSPLSERMRGYAVHGNTPFDVPFISELAPNLWQGGCQDGLVLPDFIRHVVSLYRWEAYTIPYDHNLETETTVTMYDSNDTPVFEQVLALALWVNKCRETGPVLVHCQAGLNRSSLVAAAALILEGYSPESAIEKIRQKRSPACLCNKTFERFLIDFRPGRELVDNYISRVGVLQPK